MNKIRALVSHDIKKLQKYLDLHDPKSYRQKGVPFLNPTNRSSIEQSIRKLNLVISFNQEFKKIYISQKPLF